MTGTSITLPIRVDIKTGARLEPHGGDPYTDCVWVRGADYWRSEAFRRRYSKQLADLREKLLVAQVQKETKTLQNGGTK